MDEIQQERPKQPVDTRPTDLEFFKDVLIGAVTGYAAKGSTDMPSLISAAFMCARAVTGQCCAMGVARMVTKCSDGSWLGTGNNTQPIQGVQQPIQHQPGGQGIMTNQYPTPQPQQQQYAGGQQMVVGGGQAGPGGMVAQYPTQGAPITYNGGPGGGGGPVGQMTGNGKGMTAAVVGMYGPDGTPIQPGAGAPQVMTPHGFVPVQQVPQQPQQGFAPQQPQQQGLPQQGFAPQQAQGFPQQYAAQQPGFPQQGFAPGVPGVIPGFAPGGIVPQQGFVQGQPQYQAPMQQPMQQVAAPYPQQMPAQRVG